MACAAGVDGGFCLWTHAVNKTLAKTRPTVIPLILIRKFSGIIPDFTRLNHRRFSALNTALTEASSIFVSTPAPQRHRPSANLICMYAMAAADSLELKACSL